MSGLPHSLTGASNVKRQAGRMFNSIALLELANSDGKAGDCRAVRFVVSSRGIRHGFLFFRNRQIWIRLTANIGIVLVFAVIYLIFLKRG